MKHLFVLVVFSVFLINAFSQNTQEQGAFFLGGGIGKSWAISPTFNIENNTHTKTSLSDDVYSLQLSAKIGYVFANHFATDINIERFTWNYSHNFPLINDLLYIRLGVFGMDKFFKTNKSKFAITWLLGLGAGPVFSNNKLNNYTTLFKKNDLNGFGINFNAGIRLEFYKRLFFTIEQTGGFIYQILNGDNSSINLSQPYSRINVSFGVFIYERWNESCNTCPKW